MAKGKGYKESGTLAGRTKYVCTDCGHIAIAEEAIKAHVADEHGGSAEKESASKDKK